MVGKFLKRTDPWIQRVASWTTVLWFVGVGLSSAVAGAAMSSVQRVTQLVPWELVILVGFPSFILALFGVRAAYRQWVGYKPTINTSAPENPSGVTVDDELTMMADECARLDQEFANYRAKVRVAFGQLSSILASQRDLSELERLTGYIDQFTTHLSKLSSVDGMPLDISWDRDYSFWKQNADRWDLLRSKYGVGDFSKIGDFNSDEIKGHQWSKKVDALSPDDALKYKLFRLQLRRYKDYKDQLHSRIRAEARRDFDGQSAPNDVVKKFLHLSD